MPFLGGPSAARITPLEFDVAAGESSGTATTNSGNSLTTPSAVNTGSDQRARFGSLRKASAFRTNVMAVAAQNNHLALLSSSDEEDDENENEQSHHSMADNSGLKSSSESSRLQSSRHIASGSLANSPQRMRNNSILASDSRSSRSPARRALGNGNGGVNNGNGQRKSIETLINHLTKNLESLSVLSQIPVSDISPNMTTTSAAVLTPTTTDTKSIGLETSPEASINSATVARALETFEELTASVFDETRDIEMLRVLKTHGWTGSRYRQSEDLPLDAQSLLQALSNLYLRTQLGNAKAQISNLFGFANEAGADQILSFCPDLLVTCLKSCRGKLAAAPPVMMMNNSSSTTIGPLSPTVSMKGEVPRSPSGKSPPNPGSTSPTSIKTSGEYPISNPVPSTASNPQHQVQSFKIFGACMLADISGFSKFSGSMCLKGASGLDILREATSGFLGHLVKLVYEFRGDVIAFAGDALICVFQDDDSTIDEETSAVRRASLGYARQGGDHNCRFISDGSLRALCCADKLRCHHNKELSCHVGVSHGEMTLAFLGGQHDQWVYLLNGECVSQLGDCINSAGPKEIAATRVCYDRAVDALKKLTQSVESDVTDSMKVEDMEDSKFFTTRMGDNNTVLIDNVDISALLKASDVGIGQLQAAQASRQPSCRDMRSVNSSGELKAILESAALFVPRPILSAVYAEFLDHLSEFRQVTTMFLSLDSYSPITHRDPCTLQPFFLLAQRCLFNAGGYLRQFLIDDKGCVFIAMWGMPSFTYANNCSRALSCGVNILLEVQETLQLQCSIGITTGNVFCGTVGAFERRDYCGIGNEVNLAARLMSKARGSVLTDEATYINLSQDNKDHLLPQKPMVLKGIEKPIVSYRYESNSIPGVAALDENASGGLSTILRKQVKAVLSYQMDCITNCQMGGFGVSSVSSSLEMRSVYFTIITGMPGTGKTTAADYFRHGLRKRNIPCVMIQARPGNEGVPYGLMRLLFLELVGRDQFLEEEQQRSKIHNLVAQAYPNANEVDLEDARRSVEMILGLEWSDVFSAETNSVVPTENGAAYQTDAQQKASYRTTPGRGHTVRSYAAYEDAPTISRPIGDLSFYHVLCVLLRHQKHAIVIEDAHFCDELSWNELLLLLTGSELNLVVLITMRSISSNYKTFQSPGAVPPTNGVESATVTPRSLAIRQGANTPKTQRKSILQAHNDSNPAADPYVGSVGPGSTTGHHHGADAPSEYAGDAVGRYGYRQHTAASYLSILGHANTTVLEMTPLNEMEVREILVGTLRVQHIPPHMVRLVLDVSSGNAFWCKMIAGFIKERGVQELEKATDRQSWLNQLIVLRMEKLTQDEQLVLKHAAIIGDEFSATMLREVVPKKLHCTLAEALEKLAEHGFIQCIQEVPELIFGFENALIHNTIFNLTPPRNGAYIHQIIADFIEQHYARNLRAFYPILGYHYQRAEGKRTSAFKYKVKAADQAIAQGAFNDGFVFVQSAFKMAQTKEEYRVLLSVITRSLRDIQALPLQGGKKNGGSRDTTSMVGRPTMYLQLKVNVESALERLGKGAIRSEEATPGNPNRLVINRHPSGHLAWQPSYVFSRMNESDSDSEDDVENYIEEPTSRICVIS